MGVSGCTAEAVEDGMQQYMWQTNSGPGGAAACMEMITWQEGKEHPRMASALANRALSPAVLH